MEHELVIVADAEAVAQHLAETLLAVGVGSRPAVMTDGVRHMQMVVLSGGRTPLAAYRVLVESHAELVAAREKDADAEDVQAYGPEFLYSHLFWGDERCVSPESEDSNFGMCDRVLLKPLLFPEDQIHRIEAEGDLEAAAAAYETQIHRVFASIWEMQSRIVSLLHPEGGAAATLAPDPDAWERFDLVVLGLGADGHTASLFPGSPALEETTRWVVPTVHPETGQARVTMTLPCLNRARHILLVAQGEEKADAVRRVLEPTAGEPLLPAARIQPDAGRLTILLDTAAASALQNRG